MCEQNFSDIIDGRMVGLYKQSVEVYSESFGHQMILVSGGGGGSKYSHVANVSHYY